MVGFEGRGSYEDRTEMLRLGVDFVEASIYADDPEWRLEYRSFTIWICFFFFLANFLLLGALPLLDVFYVLFVWNWFFEFLCGVDEQVAKDIQLIDATAEKQALIFSEECKLFPADVQIQSIYPLWDYIAYIPPLTISLSCLNANILYQLLNIEIVVLRQSS